MMVAAGAMPPVAEKTSGVKEPIINLREHVVRDAQSFEAFMLSEC